MSVDRIFMLMALVAIVIDWFHVELLERRIDALEEIVTRREKGATDER